MFHALTSDSKQQADATKSNPPQQQNAYPTFDGSHAFGMPRVAARIPPPSMPAAARKQHMARLQRAYGNQAVLRMLERSRPSMQPKLVVGEPDDAYEQEADRVADQVMRMPDPELSIAPAPAQVSRKCAGCEEEEKAKPLQTKPAGPSEAAAGEAPAIVHEVLRSPGQPLDAPTRAFFEPRFGHDFSQVRVHTNERAAASAQAVNALAYTVGPHIAFAVGKYAPESHGGRRLIAHELIHTIQQDTAGLLDPPPGRVCASGAASSLVQRQPDDSTTATQPDASGGSGGGDAGASSCAANPSCPSDFCLPFATQQEAKDDRDANKASVLAKIPVLKTKPLFQEFIDGGGPPRDISADFAVDFANSKTTVDITQRLEDSVKASPPTIPLGTNTVTVELKDLPNQGAINQILDKMSFGDPFEAPGLLAGGIGNNPPQSSCRVGAQTSDQDDARLAAGTVTVTKNTDGTLFISHAFTFTVLDTLDFCPGACGGGFAQVLTVPMSRWEASLISGDVPFTVVFPEPIGSAGSEG